MKKPGCFFVILSLSTGLQISSIAQTLSHENVRAILDSVRIDSMMAVLGRLSGETSCRVDGQETYLPARHTKNPDIQLAQCFLQDTFERHGYSVELQPYNRSSSLGKNNTGLLQSDTDFDLIQYSHDQNTGYLATQNEIYKTTDGGETWYPSYEGRAKDSWLSNLTVITPEVCCIAGYYYRFNSRTGTIEEENFLIRTADGGDTWDKIPLGPTQYLSGLHFFDEHSGWACTALRSVLQTNDGGNTWIEKHRDDEGDHRLNHIYFLDPALGWSIGSEGMILRTTDAGETWTEMASNNDYRLNDIHMIDANNGFIAGANRVPSGEAGSIPYYLVLRTTDGGIHWTETGDFGTINSIMHSVEFTDENTGVLIGLNHVYTTTDGGNHWENVRTALPGIYINGGDLLPNGTIWYCGEDMLYRSEDFGSVWISKLEGVGGAFVADNIIVEKPGSLYPNARFILCAHYDATSESTDTRTPGADDNGSGCAVVVEAARVLAPYDFPYTVQFVLFAGEEQGRIGSATFALNAAASSEEIKGVINLDMIGYDGDADGRFEIHFGDLPGSHQMGEFVSSRVADWNLPIEPIILTDNSTYQSDHASFWDNNIPAILIEEDWADHTPFYHSTDDIIGTIQTDYLHPISRLAIGSIALLADAQLTADVENTTTLPESFTFHTPYPNPFNPNVHLEYELHTIQNIDIHIYDTMGRKIRTLLEDRQLTGRHHLVWDSKTDRGELAPSGLYFVQIQTPQATARKKIILAR